MKINFLIAAVLTAFSTVSLPASTMEKTVTAAPEHPGLDSAVKYYKKSLVDGFCHAMKISGISVSAEQRQKVDVLAGKYIQDDLLPALKTSGLLAEWIKAQNDPEVIRINEACLKVTSQEEVQKMSLEAINFVKQKYPRILELEKNPEFVPKSRKFFLRLFAVFAD